VSVDGENSTIEDAGSRWGTKVNGESITQCELKPGDTIVVGETELRFETIISPEAITMAKPVRSSVRGLKTMRPERES
jgi:pSer/pThr/pTyr-binding forkhead associated (FHA) protein